MARSPFPVLLKGLGVTFKELAHTVKPKMGGGPPPCSTRTRRRRRRSGPAASSPCARTTARSACCAPARCPDWCIYIEGHKEKAPPRRAGGKPRTVSNLDRFDIDYALCMYCGICVEVCPFDALFWSPEYEYSEPHIADLLHDKDKLGEWMETVPEAPELEAGADKKKKK